MKLLRALDLLSVSLDRALSTMCRLPIVNFPSVRPSKSTPYTVYSREIGSSKEIAKQRTCIAGETEDVEFFSLNRDYPSSEAADCQ
jgi:DNA-directed RNA polymerase I subunit RPA49